MKGIDFRVRKTLDQNLALPLTCYEKLASCLTCLSLFFLSVKLDNRGTDQPRHSMSAVTGEILLITSKEGAMWVPDIGWSRAVKKSVQAYFALAWKDTVHPGLVFYSVLLRAFMKPWKCWCISSQWLYLPRYACPGINTTRKKLPSLDLNAAEEVSVFRVAFAIFYDAVVGSSARVPGQYTQFGKRFLALMGATGLANIDSYLNHELDQYTPLVNIVKLWIALSELLLSCEWIGGPDALNCTPCIGNQYAIITIYQDQAKCCDGTMANKETLDDIMQFYKGNKDLKSR